MLFVTLGTSILLSIIINRLIGSGYKKKDYAQTIIKNVSLFLFFTGGYAAGVVWFLKNHWQMLLLSYWEFVIVYIVLFLLLGLLLVRLIRGNEDSKHMYVVIVKWFIRLSGAVLVYQSSSSPLGSMLLIILLSLSYIIYSFHKWVIARLVTKKIHKKQQ